MSGNMIFDTDWPRDKKRIRYKLLSFHRWSSTSSIARIKVSFYPGHLLSCVTVTPDTECSQYVVTFDVGNWDRQGQFWGNKSCCCSKAAQKTTRGKSKNDHGASDMHDAAIFEFKTSIYWAEMEGIPVWMWHIHFPFQSSKINQEVNTLTILSTMNRDMTFLCCWFLFLTINHNYAFKKCP